MRKILFVAGFVTLFIIPVLVSPVLGTPIEDDNFNERAIKWKLLLVIGWIDICFEENIISGFVLIGYNAGDILTVESININFEGLPLFINKGLFFSCCLYKPIENSS